MENLGDTRGRSRFKHKKFQRRVYSTTTESDGSTDAGRSNTRSPRKYKNSAKSKRTSTKASKSKKRKHASSKSSCSSTSASASENFASVERLSERRPHSHKRKQRDMRINDVLAPGPSYQPHESCPMPQNMDVYSNYGYYFLNQDDYDRQYQHMDAESHHRYHQEDPQDYDEDFEAEFSSHGDAPPEAAPLEGAPLAVIRADQPMSPPEDLLQKTLYPPEGAQPLFSTNPSSEDVLYFYRDKQYGWFKFVKGSPPGFQVIREETWQAAEDFLALCHHDPNTNTNSASRSDDLRVGQNIMTKEAKEALGFSILHDPPTTVHFRKHPLYKELLEALNKHRVARSTKAQLLQAVKDVGAVSALRRIKNRKDGTVRPAVPQSITVTCPNGEDDILTFLNTGVARAYPYITDVGTAYTYFTLPTESTLAIQLSLKEELLLHLGSYDLFASLHFADQTHQRQNPSCYSEVEVKTRLEAFSFKTAAINAIRTAERLGAACLLLRMEATAAQRAPITDDLLVYSTDVVGSKIFALKKIEGFDTAVTNRTIKPVANLPPRFSTDNIKPSANLHADHSHQRGRFSNFRPQFNRGGNYRPFHSRLGASRPSYPPSGNSAGNSRPRGSFRSRGTRPYGRSTKTNADSRVKTRPRSTTIPPQNI